MPTPEITLAPADEKDIFLASPDILELVRDQITDTIKNLSAAIEICVTMDGTSLAFLEAIVNYTNQVQATYEVAEMAGLVGLAEVCTFINDNLMALDTQEPTAKRVAQPYFEKWPAAVLDYLQAPLTGSHRLVQMMQASAWPVPIDEETAQHWLSLLTRSSTTSEPVTALSTSDSTPDLTTFQKLSNLEAPPASSVIVDTPEPVLSVPTKTIDNLIRSVGELSISWGQIQERMKHVLQSTRVLTEHDNFMESMVDHRELARSIRHDWAKLETMFIHQQWLNQECEASVMATRMVPVNAILPRLQRRVRQTCRETNKKAELEVSGMDILIDRYVLNNLADPLQQILRNVMAHGIEVPEERVLLGKPEAGHIHLSFYREGNNVVVKCQDDGR